MREKVEKLLKEKLKSTKQGNITLSKGELEQLLKEVQEPMKWNSLKNAKPVFNELIFLRTSGETNFKICRLWSVTEYTDHLEYIFKEENTFEDLWFNEGEEIEWLKVDKIL